METPRNHQMNGKPKLPFKADYNPFPQAPESQHPLPNKLINPRFRGAQQKWALEL
jgi:hypothetical protein